MGFNTINFIINTANMLHLTNQNKSGINQNLQNQPSLLSGNLTAQLTSNMQNESSFNTFYDFEELPIAKQLIISTVEVEKQANYVKDLLNLPRDFQDLIKQIQAQDKNNQALYELSKLFKNGKISLFDLSNLLKNNSKEATQKIMNTIMAVSKMGSNDVGQLKHLMGMFMSASTQVDSVQAVKNLIMLYLPWLPLSIRHDLNLDFNLSINEKKNEEENGLETITILIQTANFGNIYATIEGGVDSDIVVIISAGEDFPEKKVMEKFQKENKTNNIKGKMDIQKTTSLSKNLKRDEQDFKITTSDFVSPKLLLAAHSIIKIIIELDSDEFIINEEEEN